MNVQNMTQEIRIKQWINIIRECHNSGMTNKSWCEEQGVNLKSYYYWQRKVRKMAGEKYAIVQSSKNRIEYEDSKPVFTEMKLPKHETTKPAVTLRIDSAVLEIQNEAELTTIENTLQALRSSC